MYDWLRPLTEAFSLLLYATDIYADRLVYKLPITADARLRVAIMICDLFEVPGVQLRFTSLHYVVAQER